MANDDRQQTYTRGAVKIVALYGDDEMLVTASRYWDGHLTSTTTDVAVVKSWLFEKP